MVTEAASMERKPIKRLNKARPAEREASKEDAPEDEKKSRSWMLRAALWPVKMTGKTVDKYLELRGRMNAAVARVEQNKNYYENQFARGGARFLSKLSRMTGIGRRDIRAASQARMRANAPDSMRKPESPGKDARTTDNVVYISPEDRALPGVEKGAATQGRIVYGGLQKRELESVGKPSLNQPDRRSGELTRRSSDMDRRRDSREGERDRGRSASMGGR